VLVAATLGACSGGTDGAPPTTPPVTSQRPAASGTTPTPAPTTPSTGAAPSGPPRLPVRQDVVATGLEVPWGLAFLPDGSALVAERKTGDVVRVRAGAAPAPVGRVAGVADLGEGGMLGLAVAPDDPRTLFAYFTTRGDNRVVAVPFDPDAAAGRGLGRPRVLLSGIPNAGHHDGGRLVVGPDGHLWIGTGDAGDTSRAQDRGSLGGKILRIATDGSVPADNPFPGSPIWSLGHRNVQGLAFDSAGRLWATEFGQNRWDELNLVTKGGNYGWPDVEGPGGGADGFVEPKVVWRTDEASPSGLAIVDDVAYVAALRGARIWVVPVRDGRAGTPVATLRDAFGRIRTLEPAADGTLWMTTSNRDGRGRPRDGDDQVVRLRLTPAP
jgi:glucose/arabinose dehydrogenase